MGLNFDQCCFWGFIIFIQVFCIPLSTLLMSDLSAAVVKNDIRFSGGFILGTNIPKRTQHDVFAYVTAPGVLVIDSSGPLDVLFDQIQKGHHLATRIAQSTIVLRDGWQKEQVVGTSCSHVKKAAITCVPYTPDGNREIGDVKRLLEELVYVSFCLCSFLSVFFF